MKNMLKEALKKVFSEDAALAKAAVIVWNNSFDHHCVRFTDSSLLNCEEDSLPSSFKSLVSLILNGLNLKIRTNMNHKLVLLVLIFYCQKRDHPKEQCKIESCSVARATYASVQWLKYDNKQEAYWSVISGGSQYLIWQSFGTWSIDCHLYLSKIWKSWFFSSYWFSERFIHYFFVQDSISHNRSSTTTVNAFHSTGITVFNFQLRQTLAREDLL